MREGALPFDPSPSHVHRPIKILTSPSFNLTQATRRPTTYLLSRMKQTHPSLGKTTLLLRFLDSDESLNANTAVTVGMDFHLHAMTVNGRKVRLSIWVSGFT